jgi:copper chaperone CopZ
MGWLSMLSSIVLSLVFVAFAVDDLRAKFRRGNASVNSGWNVSVQGMTCGGCSSRLERVLNANDEINSAHVDLEGAQARIDGVISSESLAQVIVAAGFEPGQPEAIQSS